MKTRTKERGAAMVEAIVVVMVLLVFLGMMTWAGRAYGAKIDQAAQTRSDVLYYASHACEGDLPNAVAGESDTPVATGDADDTTANAVAGKIADGTGQPTVSRDWNLAATMEESDVEGTAIVDLRKSALKTHLKTTSWVACNEKSYDNDWTAVALFTADLVWSGGGLL